VEAVYEAGPCGYTLMRQLESQRVRCSIAAPSMIPKRSGERVKTDRRDARKLGRYLRSGDLSLVRPPSEEEEAARELCRRRTAVSRDLQRARHRLNQFLLRRGQTYRSGSKWTKKHLRWLNQQTFSQPLDEEVFLDLRADIDVLELRLADLCERVIALAHGEKHRKYVGWLCCIRGIDKLIAISLLVELHGIERFEHPDQLASFLGLVPREHSSGERRSRGSITKTGNSHVRWLLVEAAWHHRHPVRVSEVLKRRRRGQPAMVVALADRAMRRLHHRFYYLVQGRKMMPQKAVVACARESVAFLWALLVKLPQEHPELSES
jgi:transposase